MPKGKKVKKIASIMHEIKNKEEWMKFFNNTEDPKLNVIDVHPSWCGGVEIMN